MSRKKKRNLWCCIEELELVKLCRKKKVCALCLRSSLLLIRFAVSRYEMCDSSLASIGLKGAL